MPGEDEGQAREARPCQPREVERVGRGPVLAVHVAARDLARPLPAEIGDEHGHLRGEAQGEPV